MKFRSTAFWIVAILPTILLALVFSNCPVFAQDATKAATRQDKAKERISTVKDKIATREAAMKKKLNAFKDRKKAETAERVSENLNKINERQTAAMLKHLDKTSAILAKLEKRVNENSPTAIASAKTTIGSATTLVKDQAAKDYTLTISSESRVKSDAQKVRDALHTDLQAVRKKVVEAKQSVAAAIRREGTTNGRE